MEIALIIVGGIVIVSIVPLLFSHLTERRKKLNKETEAKVGELEKRLDALEARLEDKTDRLTQMEKELSFVNKLLEDKPKN
ncbi:MAG TPA: hypothetical protein ENN69_08825 [Spirochaetia bacterium]|nr:hypothetical protein [Spirochaetia bacterium]